MVRSLAHPLRGARCGRLLQISILSFNSGPLASLGHTLSFPWFPRKCDVWCHIISFQGVLKLECSSRPLTLMCLSSHARGLLQVFYFWDILGGAEGDIEAACGTTNICGSSIGRQRAAAWCLLKHSVVLDPSATQARQKTYLEIKIEVSKKQCFSPEVLIKCSVNHRQNLLHPPKTSTCSWNYHEIPILSSKLTYFWTRGIIIITTIIIIITTIITIIIIIIIFIFIFIVIITINNFISWTIVVSRPSRAPSSKQSRAPFPAPNRAGPPYPALYFFKRGKDKPFCKGRGRGIWDYLADDEVHIWQVLPTGRVAWRLGWSEGFPFIAGGISLADGDIGNAAIKHN